MSAAADWFSDGDQLVTELRRSRHEREGAPTIAGYDDLELLGRGGQGIVFAATQRSTRRRVAIKLLLDGAFASSSARRRFEREVELVASLQHPGIVRVFDSGTTADGRLYTVMELLEGSTLERWAAAHGAADAPDRDGWIRARCELVAEIGDAVHAAHQRGIIHRDLKPGNVRVDAAGRPRVLDFGLAKPLDASVWRSGASVSRSGHFLGSVPWASPEQASGAAGAADVRSDLYSLGVIAYRLLTEAMPYDTSGSIGDALRAVAETPPAPPRLLGRPLGRDLETVLLKSLAKEPSRRYQSVGEFVADLRRALAGEPIDARRDSAWYLLRMAARRHRAAVAAALLLLAM
ncbi:MAG: serine/threonine protein kinase, partial [Phycisphaerae bacterium]|nr:serine/threonine protein kinase [Phycisphaerae bacterium]